MNYEKAEEMLLNKILPKYNQTPAGEAILTAINALEAQIPMSVEVEEGVNKYKEPIIRYWCPNCECEVDKDRDSYCSQCGQKIDWGEIDG